MLVLLLVLSLCGFCRNEEGDLGYSLRIGNAIDVFANYGDLSQVIQVVSAEYDADEHIEPFQEKNIRIFTDASITDGQVDTSISMYMYTCDTFEDLLQLYFKSYTIEGTEKPWKAFLGDWNQDEISRSFGLESDAYDNCCYVLVKLSKAAKAERLETIDGVHLKDYVQRAMDGLDITDMASIRTFMRSYGTHYIDYYKTGNFVYQIFKYKRTGYNLLKTYIKTRRNMRSSEDLRHYFSSYFLKQVGDIKIASGNKTIETWARTYLKDSQYLFSRPSLLRLYYNRLLVDKLSNMLDNSALLGLKLRTLAPLFKDRTKADVFTDIVDNDMKLWEVNT